MLDINYLKRMSESFMPRTPVAALKALEEGMVPVEAFVYLGTSVKPLFEKPYDIDELERVLSQKDLKVDTFILLKKIFSELVRNPDQEIALIAAEGINEIENIFNKKIEKFKETLEEDPANIESIRELARIYYEFSLINREKQVIERFYLKESFSYIKRLVKLSKMNVEDMKLLTKILISLRMYNQAFRVVENIEIQDDPEIVFLKAKIEFMRRNLSEVFQYCVELTQYEEGLTEHMKRVLSFWIGFVGKEADLK